MSVTLLTTVAKILAGWIVVGLVTWLAAFRGVGLGFEAARRRSRITPHSASRFRAGFLEPRPH